LEEEVVVGGRDVRIWKVEGEDAKVWRAER
jgi:hypothetical protein